MTHIYLTKKKYNYEKIIIDSGPGHDGIGYGRSGTGIEH